jgi:hypothetical protein
MKTLKHYSFLFKDLNEDERQILGGGIVAVLGFSFLIWLMSTNTYPVLDTKATDTQIHQKKTYELKPSFNKYMNHVYNDKYTK